MLVVCPGPPYLLLLQRRHSCLHFTHVLLSTIHLTGQLLEPPLHLTGFVFFCLQGRGDCIQGPLQALQLRSHTGGGTDGDRGLPIDSIELLQRRLQGVAFTLRVGNLQRERAKGGKKVAIDKKVSIVNPTLPLWYFATMVLPPHTFSLSVPCPEAPAAGPAATAAAAVLPECEPGGTARPPLFNTRSTDC